MIFSVMRNGRRFFQVAEGVEEDGEGVERMSREGIYDQMGKK